MRRVPFDFDTGLVFKLVILTKPRYQNSFLAFRSIRALESHIVSQTTIACNSYGLLLQLYLKFAYYLNYEKVVEAMTGELSSSSWQLKADPEV